MTIFYKATVTYRGFKLFSTDNTTTDPVKLQIILDLFTKVFPETVGYKVTASKHSVNEDAGSVMIEPVDIAEELLKFKEASDFAETFRTKTLTKG